MYPSITSGWSDEYDFGITVLYLVEVTLDVVGDYGANVVTWVDVICVTDRIDTGSEVF